jgi:hypothetical protein
MIGGGALRKLSEGIGVGYYSIDRALEKEALDL